MREYIGESLGTFILTLFGCGSVAVAVLFGEYTSIFQIAIVWGLADPYSWRMSYDNTTQPLILGDYLQAKPAYTAMLNVLKEALEATGLNKVETDHAAPVRQGAIYNLAGQQVDANYKGIIIMNGKKYIREK